MCNVLIVEDDKVTQLLLSKIVGRTASNIHIADNNIDALRIAKEIKPDVAIVDMQLKNSVGSTFINQLTHLGMKTKVIVFTADLDLYNDWINKDAKADLILEKGRSFNAFDKIKSFITNWRLPEPALAI